MRRSTDGRSIHALAAVFRGRFFWTSLAVVIVFGVVFDNYLSGYVERIIVDSYARTHATPVRTALEGFLKPADMGGGLQGARYREVGSFIDPYLKGSDVVRVKIWNRRGIVVYSDNGAIVGKEFAAEGGLARALAGKTESHVTDLKAAENAGERSRFNSLAEVYVPLTIGGATGGGATRSSATPITGAFEVYVSLLPLEAAVSQVHFVVALGLGALLLVILVIANAASLVLVRQNLELRDFGRRQEELFSAAEAASRMKTDFLSNVSHELRTPLTSILGYCDLMLEDDLGHNREFVESVRRAGGHLHQLINDMLDLSKVEAGKLNPVFEDFDIAMLIRDLKVLFTPLAEARRIRLSFPEASYPAYSDPRLVRQILFNLLSNALKFNRDGGVVSVSFTERDDEMVFSVADSGKGFGMGEAERVFEPFVQLESPQTKNHPGTGLGLTLSRRFAGALGGRLWGESEGPEQGATFHLALPLAPGTAIEILGQDGPLVAIVEDDPQQWKLFATVAIGSGLRACWLRSCVGLADAIAALHPEVVILDIVFKEGTSWRELAALKLDPRVGHVPVLVVTVVEDESRALEQGADGFLTKPVAPTVLKSRILGLLEETRARA